MKSSETIAPPRPSILPTDPAAQVVESAYQIVMMIGANPRAIRPILAQRRLTKEQVLDAAASAAERTVGSLTEMDAIEDARRTLHEATMRRLNERIDRWQAGGAPAAVQDEDSTSELIRLKAESDTALADFARFEAVQRRPRAFLTALRDRAAEVQRVYAAL